MVLGMDGLIEKILRTPEDIEPWHEVANKLERSMKVPDQLKERHIVEALIKHLDNDRESPSLRTLYLALRNMAPYKLEWSPLMEDYDELSLQLLPSWPHFRYPLQVVGGHVTHQETGLPVMGLTRLGHVMELVPAGAYELTQHGPANMGGVRPASLDGKLPTTGGPNPINEVKALYLSFDLNQVRHLELYQKRTNDTFEDRSATGKYGGLKPEDALKLCDYVNGRFPYAIEALSALCGNRQDGEYNAPQSLEGGGILMEKMDGRHIICEHRANIKCTYRLVAQTMGYTAFRIAIPALPEELNSDVGEEKK